MRRVPRVTEKSGVTRRGFFLVVGAAVVGAGGVLAFRSQDSDAIEPEPPRRLVLNGRAMTVGGKNLVLGAVHG